MNTMNKTLLLLVFTAILSVLFSCKDDNNDDLLQPDFIKTSLPVSLSIDGGQEFDLYIPDNETNVSYQWILPDALTLLEGQGTNRVRVVGKVDGGTIPVKSIGVTAEKDGKSSYTRWFYKEIVLLTPPPSLEAYKTKRYGAKTWMIENLNEAGDDGNLGWAYNNDPEKAATYGRLYTWHEAMTGISKATESQNPYSWGSSGTDDAGNAYTLDGTAANSFNIQIKGACPKGWHIPNVNDWFDLIVSIKSEYGISGTSLSDVASNKDGYVIGWGKDVGVVNSMTLTNTGLVAAYLRGSSPQSAGGLWAGNTTFSYGGNATFPKGDYPLYKDLSKEIEFNILPSGRWNSGGVGAFDSEGLYSYHWVAFLSEKSEHNPLRVTVGSANVNFSNGTETALNGYCLRCVANY